MIQQNSTRQRRLLAVPSTAHTLPRPPLPLNSHAYQRGLTHPGPLTTGCLPHPDGDIDKYSQTASSMEYGDVQNLPQTFIGCIPSEGVYTQMITEFDSQRPNFLSWNYFPPLYNQPAHYSVFPDPHWGQLECYWPLATGPTVISPWHMSGASVQVALPPSVSDENPGDEFAGGLGFDQIWANGPRPGRRITGQEDPFRGTNSPFNQGNGIDAQLCNPNPFCTTSDSQSSHTSPHQSEYIPGAHPNSLFGHRPDQRVEAPESSGSQRIPDMETARGSRIRLTDSKEWPCDRDGCNKSYGRPQDVRRHVREKHGVLPECPICGIKWARAEKIRRHILKKHREHFTKEELQQIRHLQRLNNTIDFLNEWETARL